MIIYSGGSGGNTAPSATITAPADGSGFLTTDSISFAGSASDAEDGDLSGSLSWTSDLDGVLGSEASFQASLSAGTHVITAAVVDSGGLPASDTITVTVSEPVNAAPEATITAPADGASFLTTDSISFSGSATDAEDGDISASLAWTSDLDGGIGSGATFSTTLTAGTHLITASVTDSGGLPDSDTITLTVTVPGNAAPDTTISAPADGSGFLTTDSISFSGSATDAEDGDLSGSLSWTSSLDGVIGSGAGFSATLTEGIHLITASVTDSGGLPGSDSVTVNVNPPGGTELVLTSIAAHDGYTRESSEDSNVASSINSTISDGTGLRLGDRKNDAQWRSILSFDTSAIPAGATIISATLRLRRGVLFGTNPFTTHGNAFVDVRSGGFNGNVLLEREDFQAAASVVAAATLSDAPADLDWSEGTLDSAGRDGDRHRRCHPVPDLLRAGRQRRPQQRLPGLLPG